MYRSRLENWQNLPQFTCGAKNGWIIRCSFSFRYQLIRAPNSHFFSMFSSFDEILSVWFGCSFPSLGPALRKNWVRVLPFSGAQFFLSDRIFLIQTWSPTFILSSTRETILQHLFYLSQYVSQMDYIRLGHQCEDSCPCTRY
jgi:hypothetical protein